MSKQYFIKVVRGAGGQLVYFNFGMDKHAKYENIETSLSDIEYVSITVYQPADFNEYKDAVDYLLSTRRAKLSIYI